MVGRMEMETGFAGENGSEIPQSILSAFGGGDFRPDAQRPARWRLRKRSVSLPAEESKD